MNVFIIPYGNKKGKIMITRDNYKEVCSLLNKKQIKRILNSSKEYIVLFLSCSNACVWLNITLSVLDVKIYYVKRLYIGVFHLSTKVYGMNNAIR